MYNFASGRELDVCERTLGVDHKYTVFSRNNLARLRKAQDAAAVFIYMKIELSRLKIS